jgi:hypothetical protein
MIERRWLAAGVLWAGLAPCLAAAAPADEALAQRLATRHERLALMQQRLARMPARQRALLSTAGRGLLARAAGPQRAPRSRSLLAPLASTPPPLLAAGRVSDPSVDVLYSGMEGFTQSTTSTAWCGSNVVVGYNDTGSYYDSLYYGPGGSSFDGLSRSTSKGVRFSDLGFLNPSASFDAELDGNPSLASSPTSASRPRTSLSRSPATAERASPIRCWRPASPAATRDRTSWTASGSP